DPHRATVEMLPASSCPLPPLHRDQVLRLLLPPPPGHHTLNQPAMHGSLTPTAALTVVKFWSKQFQWGRESIEDDPHTGFSTEMCMKVEDLIWLDRRLKVSRIADEMGISAGTVWEIIHEKLGMSMVSARWAPRMLMPCLKATRLQCCQENLQMFCLDQVNCFHRLVTGDETWVYHRDPESKMESMQWNKVMATVFWDIEGLLMTELQKKTPTLTEDQYLGLVNETLHWLERPEVREDPVLQALAIRSAIQICGPDLAHSDFFLFLVFKKSLCGQRVSSDEDVKASMTSWFEGQTEDYFSKRLRSLQEKWMKCTELSVDYIEK
uniref:Uncharacterized protein n=1 Tax=Paramormyrops kingsleyae TaxID=1676925 RepID=A0A3B3S168_9TELE